MKKSITKPIVILGLVSLFTDIASEMLYPVTPIFLTTTLGASVLIVGIIEGIVEAISGISKGYFGIFSDRIGKRKPFIILGYGLSAFLKPLPGVWSSIAVVLSARVGDRIGKGIRTAPRDALLASYSTPENRGAVFGFHRAMDTLGAALGPAIALIFLLFYPNHYREIFLLAFIPSILAFISTFFVKEVSFQPKSNAKNSILSSFSFWKDAPKSYKRLIVLLTLFALFNSSDVFLILRSREVGFSDFTAIGGYIFYNLIYAFASYPIGSLSDKFGKKKIFTIGLIIFSLVYFGFAFATSSWHCWLLFILYGIYAASTEGVAKAWISDLIPAEKRASALGLQTALTSIAFLIASPITGFIWDNFSSTLALSLSAVMSLLIGIYLIFSRKF